jgi:hypothetical protein
MGSYQWEVQTRQLDHISGDPIGIDYFWGRHLRVRCCPYIVECIASASTCNFCCKNLLYRNLNQNCNILYSEHLIYGLYVCTFIFLLHQESFNMILVNNPSFYDGCVTVGIRAISKISARYQTLKWPRTFLRWGTYSAHIRTIIAS